MPLFHPITGGRDVLIRGWDARGGGLFGAPRSSTDKTTGKTRHYPHHGLDVAVQPGRLILSPIDGVHLRDSIAFDDPVHRELGGIYVVGTAAWKGYETWIFYIRRIHALGRILAGEPVGFSKDLRRYYPNITNHVHIQVKEHGRWVNPVFLFGWFAPPESARTIDPATGTSVQRIWERLPMSQA